MDDQVTVEMFVDVSCPWCHGGLETSRRLLDELAADPRIPALALQWRFMRLHPLPHEGGVSLDAYFATWDGDDPNIGTTAREEVRSYARSVGVRVDFTRYAHMYDPLTAHRLLAAVRDDDGDDVPSLWSLARIVLSANFAHGVDIAELASLRGAVERAGLLVPTRIWEHLAADGHGDAVLADHARAVEVALDGVPRMYVNGTIVPTWIEPSEVRRLLRAAILGGATPTAG